MVPDDPERRAVTGGLSLSYAVVPDELAGQLEVRRQVWFVDYAGGDEERTEAELLQLIRPLDLDYALHFSSRLDAYQSIMGSKILALFLGLYLGFTFLLVQARGAQRQGVAFVDPAAESADEELEALPTAAREAALEGREMLHDLEEDEELDPRGVA